jgi:pimeloyl-ACP methyl ester carboxylesterase
MLFSHADRLTRFLDLACLFLLVLGFFNVASAADRAAREERIDIGGYKISSVFLRAGAGKSLPPIVFLHGAGGNLYDPLLSFRERLEGRADLLFVDRPGQGGSDRGAPENAYPDGQADTVAALMRKRGIAKAIIVSHSYGGAVAASFALRHPDMVIGLVFMSPAVYSWSGGIPWYYSVGSAPLSGWLFSGTFVPVLGNAFVDGATRGVFAPNPRPDNYVADSRARRILAPRAFHSTAVDVANLKAWAKKTSPLYKRIKAPTIIVTGDADKVVNPQEQARHLARDIPGARLFSIHNLGHKSDYVAGDLAVAAIETLAGEKRNLPRIARRIEARIAGDHEK